MTAIVDNFVRQQLLERRHKLERVDHAPRHFNRLIEEVDAALERLEHGTFGICEYCHESIEADRVITDPLVRFCLDHLTARQRSALEHDLELAAQVQRGLLPSEDIVCSGWRIAYSYEPAGPVSGDYCDVIDAGDGLYFMLGDVSGKGVAASMLMAHLHAMFRTLVSVGLPLKDMVSHASRVFCESTLPTQYATLVCGRAHGNGRVVLCNAGHVPPLVVRDGEVSVIEATGLPIGMFCDEDLSVSELCLEPGHTMVLYTDGVSEATDVSGTEYSRDRLSSLVGLHCALTPSALLAQCQSDLSAFRGSAQITDDITVMVLRRGEA